MDIFGTAYNAGKSWPTAIVTSRQRYGCCGSGNFLIISYKELRRLEMAVFRALQEVSGQQEMFMSGIRLSQFYGIEIDDFAHEVAQLSLWLAEHQMNALFSSEFGHSEPLLPLKDSAALIHDNSLRVNWFDVCPKVEGVEVYICGNPPFLGHNARHESQVDDMALVLSEFKGYKKLDYVACWFWKGANYIRDGRGELAFVATSSLCQGLQVATLWPFILDIGVVVRFAYQSFPWSNSAKSNAAVHVVVVGLSTQKDCKRFLFKKYSEGWVSQSPVNISPYLLDGGNIVVGKRSFPLVKSSIMQFGNMPNDGGNFLLSPEEKDFLIEECPGAAAWVRRFVGAEEFTKGRERYCLWLKDIAAKDYEKCAPVHSRVEGVRRVRLSSKSEGARKAADRPNEFWFISHPDEGGYILVPSATSSRRDYAPIGFFDSKVIASNAVQIIPNGTLYEFSILSSCLHMDWLRLVGGRLKSDYRYSAQLVYNTFPWPEASDRQRQEIEKLGREVILARAAHPDKTMAQLYDPDKMPENLLEAHQALDRAVEKLYRDRPFRDTAERQEYLLARYEELIEAEKAAKVGGKKKTRKATTTEG
ncbi:class I SAM-dependent DNA methyltransferase [Halomonas sp. AOP42-E1-40]